MAGNVPFLMKDLVLLAVSFYLLKQDVVRVSLAAGKAADTRIAGAGVAGASLTAPNRGHRFDASGLRPFCQA